MMGRAWKATLATVLAGLVAGCAADEHGIAAGPTPRLEATMFRQVLTHLTTASERPVDGDWPEDFGDANYYGPAFFARYGQASGVSEQLALAGETKLHNLDLIADGKKNIAVFIDKLDYLLMGALGLVELHGIDPDAGALEQIDSFITVTNTLASTFDYYPEATPGVDSYAISTYGGTTMNATLALLSFEHAGSVGDDSKAQRIADGETILQRGFEKAFDAKLGFYRFAPGIDRLYLYPNVTQMLALVRAYELTGKRLYLDRAESLFGAIQPLKVAGEGRYRSPYSAKQMGAQSDDYTTFSSQNYTMLALGLLYANTKDPRYRAEIEQMLTYLRQRLLVGGRVLHHWMDGRLAAPKDPEFYCSGCNLQLLYLIWRLETLLAS
jgi:hypothetical protein